MKDLKNSFLCLMVLVSPSHTGSGEYVQMHRNECVKGTCHDCRGASYFDGYPRHHSRGDGDNNEQETMCTLQTFGPIHEDRDQQPLRSARRNDAENDDNVPVATTRKKHRLVSEMIWQPCLKHC